MKDILANVSSTDLGSVAFPTTATKHIPLDPRGKQVAECHLNAMDHHEARSLATGAAIGAGCSEHGADAYWKSRGVSNHEQVVEAGYALARKQITFDQIAGRCMLRAMGVHPDEKGMTKSETIQAAMYLSAAQGGFSSSSLQTILSNVMGISLADGWIAATADNMLHQKLTRVVSATDYLDNITLGVAIDEFLDRVEGSGEIPHSFIKEDNVVTVRMSDFARILILDRQRLLNGPIQLAVDAGKQLSAMAGRTIERDTVTLLVGAGSSYFRTSDTADGKQNSLIAPALNESNLDIAMQNLRQQVVSTDSGVPVNLTPRYLIVGESDAVEAEKLCNSASGVAPSLTPIVTPWLHSDLVGSETGWYVAASDGNVAPIVRSHLDGNTTPSIRIGSADQYSVLGGLAARIVYPYGLALGDSRAIVRVRPS